MLLNQRTLDAIAAGDVDLVFRRWKRPTVRAGGRLRTRIGELSIDEVRVVDSATVRDGDARRAGFRSRHELLAELARYRDGDLYRVRVRLRGPDPRAVLRESEPSDDEIAAIDRRLQRLDRASRNGPWTSAVLELIARRPAIRAPDLAAQLGRDTVSFKRDVRKLKELGLTESLPVGYRLSRRGHSYARQRGIG